VTADHLAVNLAHWNERAPAHAASPGYAVDRFVTEPRFLSDVVRFDLPRLGDINGLRGVHLQCHIGTDTISLSRLGASMTGLDFSPASLAEARMLAATTGANVTFVESELYGAPEVLPPAAFDLVYTGIGALCWLPDIRRWAAVVAALLTPGGRLFLREGHPVLWSIDERRTDDLAIHLPYFETPDPTVWNEQGTYVESDVQFVHTESRDWNHGLGEIMTALLDEGLTITRFVEHDSVPWNALPGQMQQVAPFGEWRLTDRPERLPHSYTLQAVRSRSTTAVLSVRATAPDPAGTVRAVRR
jgi:SAM-dependent methyltransferase